MLSVFTIGYEDATVAGFQDALRDAKIDLLVDGRAFARAGRPEEMKKIFRTQLATDDAQAQLAQVADLVKQGRRVALLCLEADSRVCHRSIVAAEVARITGAKVVNRSAGGDED